MVTVNGKHFEIVHAIRQLVLDGRYAPGSRMPTSRELAVQYRASSATVNRALQILIQDGYVRTDGRRGTFIRKTPPFLCQYGLLAWNSRGDTPFVRAMLDEARTMRQGARRLRLYSAREGQDESLLYERLRCDLDKHVLAGLFVLWTRDAASRPLPAGLRLPVIAISQGQFDLPPGLPVICHDYRHFIDRALQTFFESGKQRVAGLFTTETAIPWMRYLPQMASDCGLQTRPEWLQTLADDSTQSMQALLRLLFHSEDANRRPDALLIFDDALAVPAVEAVQALGLNLPNDLQIVCFRSAPNPTLDSLPVVRVGFPRRPLFERAMDLSKALAEGGQPQLFVPLPAGEHELEVSLIGN